METHVDSVVVPEATVNAIVDWLGRQAPALPAPIDISVSSEHSSRETVERVTWLGPDEDIFSITAEAATPDRRGRQLTCVMFNSGAQYHLGPQRLYVDLARALAPQGVRSARIDFHGIGDTGPGDDVTATTGKAMSRIYAAQCLDDIDIALDHLSEGPVAALGLCSGAYHALEAAARRDLVGSIAIHPPAEMGLLATRIWRGGAYRPFARSVEDRAWLSAARRTRIGLGLIRRAPGTVWALLDRLHLQPSPASGLRMLERNGTEVLVLVEEDVARTALGQALMRRSPPGRITVTSVDHALLGSAGRRAVRQACIERLQTWAGSQQPLHRSGGSETERVIHSATTLQRPRLACSTRQLALQTGTDPQ